MSQENLKKLLIEYEDEFGEPFPFVGYDDDEIEALIVTALKDKKPAPGAEGKAPDGALL